MTDNPVPLPVPLPVPVSDLGPAAPRRRTPVPAAVLAVALCAAGVAVVGPWLAAPPAISLSLFLGGSALMLFGLRRHYPHAGFGPANAVTLVRLALVAMLAATLPGQAPVWPVVAVATVAFALDGVDGWLARRTGLASRFGARFDVEVDCAFALVLAVIVLEGGKVGPWVLALGLARYAFWAAALAAPRLAGSLPERWSRKAVCVVQIAVLIALVSPVVGPPLAPVLAAGALTLVAWSFALDARHLWRRAA